MRLKVNKLYINQKISYLQTRLRIAFILFSSRASE